MRRTHVMHTRDNRRPHYYKQVDHHDSRPSLMWSRSGLEQSMTLTHGGEDQCVARVVKVDGGEIGHVWDHVWGQPREARHDAIIVSGPQAGTRKAFDDCDSARLFCERLFSPTS